MAAIVEASKLDSVLGSDVKYDVKNESMQVWDNGVFNNELLRQGLVLDGQAGLVANSPLEKGTYQGTQMALTKLYGMLEDEAVAHFNSMGFEPIIPVKRDLNDKKAVYQWSKPDGYPPHLQTVPTDQKSTELENGKVVPGAAGVLFDPTQAVEVKSIAQTFQFLIPQNIYSKAPYKGPTLADCEKYNIDNPSAKTDVMNGENIGFKPDWYSDARFAQQSLTGTNPTTIAKASTQKVAQYVQEADKQGLSDMKKLLSDLQDIYIQDYSYFRSAIGMKPNEDLLSRVADFKITPDGEKIQSGNIATRFGCAPVCIFELRPDGRLHPLAITIDYRTSLEDSVTIFNKRLHPDDTSAIAEKDDWPWRYAKTCVQSADWARHEIVVHLVDTHMVEEAIIVAANRTLPEDHLIFELLKPHWYRTLALNNGARTLLVPAVVARLAGFGPSIDPATSKCLDFIRWSYANFDFQGKYVPNDLKNRGFPIDDELYQNDKYKNYSYARDILLLWGVLRRFVEAYVGVKYNNDADVQCDPYIKDFCAEVQGPGSLKSFPTITTLDQLIDAITMCIHIASPQHTAVNYLQDYYYSFVPSKPPALCRPLPTKLKSLQAYTEADLTDALPIGESEAKWKDWLLAAQMPELLSYKVQTDYNLLTYAKSLYNVNKDRTTAEKQEGYDKIRDAASWLYNALGCLADYFIEQSKQQTQGTIEYNVLAPEVTAISILI